MESGSLVATMSENACRNRRLAREIHFARVCRVASFPFNFLPLLHYEVFSRNPPTCERILGAGSLLRTVASQLKDNRPRIKSSHDLARQKREFKRGGCAVGNRRTFRQQRGVWAVNGHLPFLWGKRPCDRPGGRPGALEDG